MPADVAVPAPAAVAAVVDDAPPLLLFDCLAPFFAGADDDAGVKVVNWSKIPFARLERDGRLDPDALAAVLPAFERHVSAMASLGYNAVMLDDLAHLVGHRFYPEPLRRKLDGYRVLYRDLFATAKRHGLRVFVSSDYLFYNPAIERYLATSDTGAAEFFAETIAQAVAHYPELDGLVLRLGESDGVEVRGDFHSRLTVRTARDARDLLDRLLPLFEGWNKTLVLRTWTLGAYPIGDLIWNPATYDAVFGERASPNLIVSLKYGEADFFRFLPLNPLLFRGPQDKLVELQCRREYEGMGEFPSFVGWRYGAYLAALREGGCRLAGMWGLQGGGWAPFARLAHCEGGSFWNELNGEVAVGLFSGRASVAELVAAFCRERGIADVGRFLCLLRLADEAIEDGLYIREFAAQAVYFRRVRVPPLLWVFWHHVTVGGLIAELHRALVRDKPAAVAEGNRAVATVRRMLALSGELGLPERDLRFQLATFEVLAALRPRLLGVETGADRDRLKRLIPAYRRTYPNGYRFEDPAARATPARRRSALLFALVLRRRRRYRLRDRLLLNRHAGPLRRLLLRHRQAALPAFVDRQGMSTDVLLR